MKKKGLLRRTPRRPRRIPPGLLSLRRALGQKILQMRLSSGYSQEQFARACDTNADYLRMVERGESNLTLAILLRIARQLNTTVSLLFSDIE